LVCSGLLPADQAAYDAIKGSIPNIAPRGTINGDWTGVKYDIAADPDCWWTDTGCTTPKLAGVPADVTTCPEANTWGFTLDDGPNCSHNAYFDYLQSIEQKATLFYIGSNLADWPLEGQRGLADGHEICAHSKSRRKGVERHKGPSAAARNADPALLFVILPQPGPTRT
jgi:hypothetical protein